MEVAEVARHFRAVWLGGRYGGGKTLLAVSIAKYLSFVHGYSVVSNVPLRGCFSLVRKDVDVFSCEHSVVVFDESWQELGLGASKGVVREWLAYLRKRDVILLCPSVLPLSRELSVFRVERLLNFGLLWIYRAVIAGGAGKRWQHSFLHFELPRSTFADYDHLAIPDSNFTLYEKVS